MRCSWQVRGRRSRRRGLRRAGSHGPRWQYWRSSPGGVRLGVSWAWPRRFPTVVVAAEPHDRGGSGSLKGLASLAMAMSTTPFLLLRCTEGILQRFLFPSPHFRPRPGRVAGYLFPLFESTFLGACIGALLSSESAEFYCPGIGRSGLTQTRVVRLQPRTPNWAGLPRPALPLFG